GTDDRDDAAGGGTAQRRARAERRASREAREDGGGHGAAASGGRRTRGVGRVVRGAGAVPPQGSQRSDLRRAGEGTAGTRRQVQRVRGGGRRRRALPEAPGWDRGVPRAVRQHERVSVDLPGGWGPQRSNDRAARARGGLGRARDARTGRRTAERLRSEAAP